MKQKTMISFRARVIALMLLCWVLPLILIVGVNINYMTSDRLQNKISKEVERLTYSSKAALQQLGEAIESSRQASYDREILRNYNLYMDGTMSQYELILNSFYYLRDNYSRDENILMATLWFRKDPNHLYCSSYNTGEGATYAVVREYWDKDHAAIMALSENLDTRTAFYMNEGRLYLVRNLVTNHYENAATLVFLLNQDFCFKSFEAFTDGTEVTLDLDGNIIQYKGRPVTAEETGLQDSTARSGYSWDQDSLKIYYVAKARDHTLTGMIRFGNDSGFTLFHGMDAFFALMAVCLIPLILTLLSVFYKHVTTPIKKMMEGAEEIEQGNLGYQLDYEPSSTEFKYLADSFNTMSKRLEYQFHHIYEEELALRDAKIKALQSHINPHFMNNTLEIINWEARFAGNDKVCEMIEALSTLMNAGIDRKMRPIIPLSEEMIYVNAYLHITKERLGSRLTLINEFPEDIMDYLVPRLILQPVIENAIEHGVVENGKGTVILYGYRQGDFLYLEILNESVLTDEDEAKIKRLLHPEYDTSKESSGNLGIANVNQRLRIIYGEDSGLSVEKMDENHVRSRLTIRVNPSVEENQAPDLPDLAKKPRPDNK